MLRLPRFRYLRPSTLSEAVRALADEGSEARLVSGGTDLIPNLKRRHQSASCLVALTSIAELRGVRGRAGGELRIGAATPLAAVVSDPLVRTTQPALTRAAQAVASPAIRSAATIGGNLCVDTRCTYYNQTEEWRRAIDYCKKERGDVCWVAPSSPRCWAVSSTDCAPMLIALGARVRLVSREGERVVEVDELYRDDGIEYLTRRADEILAEVIIPAPSGAQGTFWKLRRRGAIDFAVLSVAAAVRRGADGTVEEARIQLGGIGSRPVRAEAAEQALIGGLLDERSIAAAAASGRKGTTPLGNTDFVPQWRGKMVQVYVEGALRELAGLEVRGLPPRHGFGAA